MPGRCKNCHVVYNIYCMNLLVTGGLGFIGSNYITQRRELGDNIINIDAETYAANHGNIKPVSTGKYTWVKGDINDASLVSSLLYQHDIDAVVHFAAESHVDNSIKNSGVFIRTNINGTHNLLECIKNSEKPTIRFVHVSTDEVYGDLTETEPAFTEHSAIKPNSPYSASKAASDLLVRSYHVTHGMNTCITRCSNNYGPNQHVEKLIPLMITKALNGDNLPVYGDGRNIRDWIHVSDHCRAVSAVLEHGKPGGVYNIGGETEIRNIDLVMMILDQLSIPHTHIKYVQDRQGHDWRYAMNIDKIRNELGWEPQVNFKTGLYDLINHYR